MGRHLHNAICFSIRRRPAGTGTSDLGSFYPVQMAQPRHPPRQDTPVRGGFAANGDILRANRVAKRFPVPGVALLRRQRPRQALVLNVPETLMKWL